MMRTTTSWSNMLYSRDATNPPVVLSHLLPVPVPSLVVSTLNEYKLPSIAQHPLRPQLGSRSSSRRKTTRTFDRRHREPRQAAVTFTRHRVLIIRIITITIIRPTLPIEASVLRLILPTRTTSRTSRKRNTTMRTMRTTMMVRAAAL